MEVHDEISEFLGLCEKYNNVKPSDIARDPELAEELRREMTSFVTRHKERSVRRYGRYENKQRFTDIL